MSNHTPGPWDYNFESTDSEWCIVTAPGGMIIANVNADKRQIYNADLIAAAPDLLDALKAFIPGAEAMGWDTSKAIDAIAKAEGRA